MKTMLATSLIVSCLMACVVSVKTKRSVEKKDYNYTVTDEAWFDIEVKDCDGPGEHWKGRFEIGLFGDTSPMTVMNFVSLVRGLTRDATVFEYNGTIIHRIVKDFLIQMGDVTTGDGTGGTSMFGPNFNDEQFILSHRSPGMVSMANKGKNTNASQFFIIMVKARWMDGKHVVFGKVIRGFDDVKKINSIETYPETSWPIRKVKVVDCGVKSLSETYVLTETQLESEDDIPDK